ncbi:MAG TPA: SurA N-terminal domain-containing protein [Chloroflexia bacterium]|nr:SurA N-terminal domain-containing protein [Chloroflexia bacterium]
MPNPYTILKVPSDADIEEIEAAYERLFDRYEAKAQAGDAQAIALLERLNEAFDTLSDPERRAALNAELDGTEPAQVAPTRPKSKPQPRPQAPGRFPHPAYSGGRTRSQSQSLRARQQATARSRRIQEERSISITPFILLGFLGFALAAAITYFVVSKKDASPIVQTENRGAVVATVNGQPIYQQDFLERAEMDKNSALNDPIFGAYLQTLTPFSQTQAFETFRSDSLDRLINFEVLLQQARKEGLYPEQPLQQASLVEEAKMKEVQGQSFEEFLKSRNLTEGQYKRRIIRNVVYTVMADAHMPKTGSPDERRSAFFQWICDTRKSYDVKINITFAVDNPPCTSDLPPELPLPGIDDIVPEPEATAIVPPTPPGPQGPPAPPN